MRRKIIFLYDYTGIMAQPWLDAGYECWCFDGQHPNGITRDGLHVKVGMWFDPYKLQEHVACIKNMVGSGVHMVFGFPECTHLAVLGAAHFAKKLEVNPSIQREATALAKLVMYLGEALKCRWAAENPVSVLSTLWRKPDFSFHPWEYGGYLPTDDIHPLYPDYVAARDAYPKKTCIWCSSDFIQPPKIPVYCPPGYSKQHSTLGGKSIKTKNIRSATPRGFAQAVYITNKE